MRYIFRKIICAIVIFASLNVSGQKALSVNKNTHLEVFQKSKLLGDITTGIVSLNYLILSEPDKYQSYSDTLARLYFDAGYYYQCNNLCSILLTKQPEKEALLALRAASLQQIGQSSSAAEIYNQLYTRTKNYKYGVELVQIQLTLQRVKECIATSEQLLEQNIQAKVTVPRKDNKSQQEVSLKSLIYYIQGLAYNLSKDEVKSISAIEKAIAEEKGFELANSALETLKAPKTTESAKIDTETKK